MYNLGNEQNGRYFVAESGEEIERTYIAEVEGKWYAFAADVKNGNCYSIGKDNPESGRMMARITDKGIKYVASSSPSRKAAYSKACRNGKYSGELE